MVPQWHVGTLVTTVSACSLVKQGSGAALLLRALYQLQYHVDALICRSMGHVGIQALRAVLTAVCAAVLVAVLAAVLADAYTAVLAAGFAAALAVCLAPPQSTTWPPSSLSAKRGSMMQERSRQPRQSAPWCCQTAAS